MTSTDHTPSRGCYQRGCEDKACILEGYRYRKQLNLEHNRGQYRLKDSTQTRVHMERLQAAGWSTAQIARKAKLSHSTLSDISAGRPRISRETAAAVLNIHIGPPVEAPPVDAVGTVRRLRALLYIGHSLRRIASHADMSIAKLGKLAAGQFSKVSPQTAESIARAYRLLSSAPGTSPQSRGHARRNGWHGPLAWDDIDDPAAEPEEAEPYKPISTNGRDSLRKAEIEHLYLLGESIPSIAKKFDGNEKYTSDLLGAALRERPQRIARQQRMGAAA